MDGGSPSPGSRSAAGSTCGSFTAPTRPSPPTWPGAGTATWAASAHWHCGSTRWDSRPSNGVPGATRCGGYTRPCSGCWRWNPSRSTRACNTPAGTWPYRRRHYPLADRPLSLTDRPLPSAGRPFLEERSEHRDLAGCRPGEETATVGFHAAPQVGRPSLVAAQPDQPGGSPNSGEPASAIAVAKLVIAG